MAEASPRAEPDRGLSLPPRRAAWTLAIAAALLYCALVPFPLTDGDSCEYASLGREMGRGGWRAWVAPTWDLAGATSCFHEHPPGGCWGTALLVALGVPWRDAPLVANAGWMLAALGGVVALARRFTTTTAAYVAGAVFLLHIQPLKYVQRAALEFPFAACAAWAVVAALRLRERRVWVVAFGVALAGAFLTRGALALGVVAAIAWTVADKDLRPPLARLVAGVGLAAAALVVFDRLHDASTGHGFWTEYVRRQVEPSLRAGGTRHSEDGGTAAYFLGRAAVYALPWVVLPFVALVRHARGWSPVRAPAAWRLAAVWIAAVLLGAALTTRPASRYLFQIWVPASLLFALAVPVAALERLRRPLTWGVPFLVVLLAAGHSLTARRDDWWTTAETIRRWRAGLGDEPLPDVRGAFPPAEGRMKSFLRFHLDTAVHAPARDGAEIPGELRWVAPEDPPLLDAEVVLFTRLGTLFAP